MNREEAIKIFSGIASLAKINTEPTMSVCNVKNEVFTEIQALLSPQPNPITGLVPCGCAGKPEYHSSKDGYVASVKMHAECPDCHAKTAEYYAFLYSDDAFEVLQRRVMDAWNTMRGYKK